MPCCAAYVAWSKDEFSHPVAIRARAESSKVFILS
jgi:hypothetical protein